MGLDFDAVEYCKNIKKKHSDPPYACPVQDCGRSYKTLIGLQYHLLKYDHDNPLPLTPVMMSSRKKARFRGGPNSSTPKTAKGGGDEMQAGPNAVGKQNASNPEAMVTYNEETETVQFNFNGKSVRLDVDDPLPLINQEEFADLLRRGCIINAKDPKIEENAAWANVQVPVANCTKLENYNVPDAPPRPLAYYRFIERTAEELDGEIEYDVDEEDCAWLEHMNEQREQSALNVVSIDTMELLMDRLEKESFFQAAANGTAMGVEVDENAVCCICLDGECQNTNVILFCDMCNLAVHQDCYGVPYIPEGQWLCRRCLQSPSTPVNCVLCPNTGGAFKQTDRGQWAHVVCALWIPEVRFANTVFLEPIDSIETIPPARWRLKCYVCKEKDLGACIQCHRNSCYAAFHVTCAQQAGLYMTMDMKEGHNNSSCHVQKYAYCHAHTPPDAKLRPNQKDFENARKKMKEARIALAKKRSTAPVVLIPTIPPERVHEISSMVHMQKKKEFLDRLIAYWTLKRQYRNGVPLLRRLQSQGANHGGVIQRNGIEGTPDTNELYRQLKYWQCLRQDLERARLLCELVRKREKLKKQDVLLQEKIVMLQINPLKWMMHKLLEILESKDTSEIFREPVDTNEVPDYLDIVSHPMDLGTMRKKLESEEYEHIDQMENDFDLMIQNCLAYNNKDTVFYRAGIRMRDQAGPLFNQVRKTLEREGLLTESNANHVDHVEQEVEDELRRLLAAQPSEEIVQKLLILADKSQVLKNPTYRTKKIKQIRWEIARMRKALQKAKAAARSYHHAHSQSENEDESFELNSSKELNHSSKRANISASSLDNNLITPKRARKSLPAIDMDLEEEDTIGDELKQVNNVVESSPCSPVKSLNNSSSPVGVNRRTAVLFTRKAKAAMKRPSESTQTVKEENTHLATTTTTSSTTGNLTTSLLTPNNNNNNATATNAAGAAAAATLASTAFALNNKLNTSNHLAPLGFNSTPQSTGKSPKRNARHKRLSEMRNSASMSPKKSPNSSLTVTTTPLGSAAALAAGANSITSSVNNSTSLLTTATPSLSFGKKLPDSFRVYRANNERDNSDSDDDDMSDISGSPCSSCSGFSVSGTCSEYDSSEDDDEDMDRNSTIAQKDLSMHQQQQQPKDTEEEEDDDEEDEEDEEEEEDDDEEEEENDDNHSQVSSQKDNLNLNMKNSAGGNGEAQTCTEDSDNTDSDMKTEVSSEQQPINRRITRRTPTPAEKPKIMRGKQNKKLNNLKSNASNASKTPTPPPQATPPLRIIARRASTMNQSLLSKSAASSNANNSTTSTMTTRATTPLAKNVNNSKTRKGAVASAAITSLNKTQNQTSLTSTASTTTTTTTTTPTMPPTNNTTQTNNSSTNNNKTKLNHINNRRKSVISPAPAPPVQAASITTAKSQPITTTTNNIQEKSKMMSKPPLEPLQLVWAKCRGYPWYPALILDPKTPKGFVYNGVPLPAPPVEVLNLRKNYPDDEMFLVLFFDAKRTWQWLPANKLEILGIDKEHDQQKLIESRKPTERKAVKKAYQDALLYQSQVSDLEGQGPDPIM